MLDIKSRRPVPLPRPILDMTSENVSHVMELQSHRLPKLDNIQLFKSFDVRKSDLDINRHVNNVRYIEWIIETLPGDHEPLELDIEFHAECNYGDSIISELGKQKYRDGYLHQIRRERDDEILARAQSLFTAG